LSAVIVGGFTQVMIFSVVVPPLPPDEAPLEQAAATTVTAMTSEQVRIDRVLLLSGNFFTRISCS
jgi:hypothetical protein